MKKKILLLSLFFECILFYIFNYYHFYMFRNIVIALFIVSFIYGSYKFFSYKIVFINKSERIKVNDIKKVSVVIPNYNYAHYIERRIDSIINQTYPIFELIILDDCSSDNSVEVINSKIDSLKKSNPDLKIKFVINKKNSGNVFKQWQKAFELSSGDYLWIAEADDLCSEYFLNVAMGNFINDDVVLSFTESLGIDEKENYLCKDFRLYSDPYRIKLWNKSFTMSGKEYINKSLCVNNSITNASGVVLKKIKSFNYKKIFSECQNFKLSGDWYFYINYISNGSISYSSDSLNYHRSHSNSVTSSTKSDLKLKEIKSIQKYCTDNFEIEKKYLKFANRFYKDLKRGFK